ncbi:uncharacterized protein LOC117110417 [Anneissia japonica]|uniref:uncharacterized protein LOC117110417 n=1 Tax=Anneissia japonica TaxID=1529436 RepID=UPI0014258B59|nr:uncharacterized protein LOC117110417 [Anneissia japonica]
MKVFSFEYMHNTRLLTAVIGLILYVKLTNTAHPGSSYGENVVFMYDEKLAQFIPSCKCHIEGTETSHFHKWFKLEEDGPTYDLCYAGSYVAEITSTKAVCKPCIIGTYNPSPNACPYCLMCRTCGELENEVTECSSTVNRICECKSGESCYSAPFNGLYYHHQHLDNEAESKKITHNIAIDLIEQKHDSCWPYQRY